MSARVGRSTRSCRTSVAAPSVGQRPRIMAHAGEGAHWRHDAFAQQGRPVDEVIADLLELRSGDVKWRDGRTFGLVYDGGPSVHAVAEAAAQLFLHENALNTQAFPSLRQIQADTVGWTAGLLHGDDDVAGFLTSGGTESILCGVLAARERAAHERGITEPEIVLPESAHAAFHKAAHNFGLTVRKAPVRADWTADVEAMAELVDPNTAIVVGSAPQYPQGVQDDIPAIAALAASVGANCHVDACMGGFVLPFAEMLGRPVAPWDFRVDGVTTISADIHKLGYAPKGVSVILHRTKESRRYQTFVFDDWLGGFYASPNMQGTRSGLPMACAWAVMSHLGVDGYVELTRQTLANADQIRPASPRSTGSACSVTARSTSWRWPPIPRPTATSTCSRSATRCSRRAGTTTARRRRTTCIRR